MTNKEFADELVRRLNLLLPDPQVARDVKALIETRVLCSKETDEHAFLRTYPVSKEQMALGPLGLLNGLLQDEDIVIVAVYGRSGPERIHTIEAFDVDRMSELVDRHASPVVAGEEPQVPE